VGREGSGVELPSQSIRLSFGFEGQDDKCLEAREYTRGEIVDRDYRFALTLKNVGTFLDISGGLSSD